MERLEVRVEAARVGARSKDVVHAGDDQGVLMALLEIPILNSTFDPVAETITYKADHNIGLAMDTSQGLLVPTIKRVQTHSASEIAVELQRLHDLGLKGKLGEADLADVLQHRSIGGTYASRSSCRLRWLRALASSRRCRGSTGTATWSRRMSSTSADGRSQGHRRRHHRHALKHHEGIFRAPSHMITDMH